MIKTNVTMRSLASVCALASALLLASCAAPPTAPAAPAAVTIKGADFSFEAPDSLPAGLTTIDFQNVGQEYHHVQLARLNDGVTLPQLQEALQKEGEAAIRLVTLVGGVAALDPGGNGSVTLELANGQYVLLCFIPSADNVPHLAKGMIRPLTVTGSASAAASVPQAAVTVDMEDFHFTMPAEVKAGRQVWKVVNKGPQPHEISIARLADGKTLDEAAAWFAKPEGPPPFQLVGGMQGMNAGAPDAYINLDLQPGSYVAMCAIPDPATGKAHSDLGMVMPFTVK
jgi:hypothetical protein